MTTIMSPALRAGASAVLMAGLFIGAAPQAFKRHSAGDAEPMGQTVRAALWPRPHPQAPLLAAACIALAGETYSHVGVADEAVRPFDSVCGERTN